MTISDLPITKVSRQPSPFELGNYQRLSIMFKKLKKHWLKGQTTWYPTCWPLRPFGGLGSRYCIFLDRVLQEQINVNMVHAKHFTFVFQVYFMEKTRKKVQTWRKTLVIKGLQWEITRNISAIDTIHHNNMHFECW